MWTAMLYLGLRPGEAAGLAWPDVNFNAKTIHIWRSMSRTATGAAVLADTKTPQSVRSLDAPKPVLDAFRRRRTEQQQQRLAAGSLWRNEHDLVFTSPTGHPIDAAACRRQLTAIGESAGLGAWRPNELRHAAASLMSDAGVPIEQVADQLGHKDLPMLQKHYRHRIRPTVGAGLVLDETLRRPSSRR
jgi:integrase